MEQVNLDLKNYKMKLLLLQTVTVFFLNFFRGLSVISFSMLVASPDSCQGQPPSSKGTEFVGTSW